MPHISRLTRDLLKTSRERLIHVKKAGDGNPHLVLAHCLLLSYFE